MGCYTARVFHLPRWKTHALASASVEKATVMATNTPRGPRLVKRESAQASGTSHSQKQTVLSSVGVQVSPAPLIPLVRTIPYA